MHGISLPPGEFGGPWIDRLFTNTLPLDVHPYFAEIGALRVSSHLVVARDGALTQFVRFTDRAWHAGQSSYEGRDACNDFSIGVELEGVDTLPYEAGAIRARSPSVVAALCRGLSAAVSAARGRTQRHCARAARPIPDRHSTGRGRARLIAAAGAKT